MNKANPHNNICLVWDKDSDSPKGDWMTLLWSGFAESNKLNRFSIPRLVEENAEELRSEYLSRIYNLGETVINDKRLIDHLELRPGFSYWWMNLITYKANAFASPKIVDAIKMIAFDIFIESFKVSKLYLVSNDEKLAMVFKHWCIKKKCGFEWKKVEKKKLSTSYVRRFYHSCPPFIKAAFYLLRHTLIRWPLRKVGIEKIRKSYAEITFCGHFFNIDKKRLAERRFRSGYWNDLHDLIENRKINTNWFQKYIKHENVSSAICAKKIVKILNQNKDKNGCHTFLDSALNCRIILRTIGDYLHIVRIGLTLNKSVKSLFMPSNSNIDMWPFLKEDWESSMFGVEAISNCLELNSAEFLTKQVRPQKLGFYLQENQPWEMAYIYAWKAAGHGRLIGVPHVTVRFWDLRYFNDPKTYIKAKKNRMPLPDLVALNGPVAQDLYKDSGYPEDKITAVEALRYLYLGKLASAKISTKQSEKFRVLVLGDYLEHETRRQMELLQNTAHLLSQESVFVCKPHPACPIDPNDYPGLSLLITNDPLDRLLTDCDVAYTSSITSAAVDAWYAGLPVISISSGETLNMSPLRGKKGVDYVTSPEEIVDAITNINKRIPGGAKNYFYLDNKLPRWKNILFGEPIKKICIHSRGNQTAINS